MTGVPLYREFADCTSLVITCLCGCGRSETLSGDGATLEMTPVEKDAEWGAGSEFSHYRVKMPAVPPHGNKPVKVRGETPTTIFAFPYLTQVGGSWASWPDRNGDHFAVREKHT